MQPAPRSTATLAAAALAILGLFAADRAAAQCVDKLENGQVLVLDWGAIFLIDDVSIGADPDSNQQSVCGGQSGSALTNDRLGRLWVATGDDAVRIDPAETRLHAVPMDWFSNGRGWVSEGIAKAPNGDVLLAHSNPGSIARLDVATGFEVPWYPNTPGTPSGLVLDPHSEAAPSDTLLSVLASTDPDTPAGVYAVDETGSAELLATHGLLATPRRIAATGDRFIYTADGGGAMDPDGAGPAPETTRPAQVIQIDRSVTLDFEDPAVDYGANQVAVAAIFDPQDQPTGIGVLDGDGVAPDTLIVSVSRGADEVGHILRIDFDPEDPANAATTETRVVSRGQAFDEPQAVHIVTGIEPEALLYATACQDSGGPCGLYVLDPRAPDNTPPQLLASGVNGPLVVHPDDTNRLITMGHTETGEYAVIEVDATTGAKQVVGGAGVIRGGGNLIVDSAGDIIVADGDRILRIDTEGVSHVLSPAPGEANFYEAEAVAIDAAGYLLVLNDMKSWSGEPYVDWGQLIRVSPATGRQWCIAESNIAGTAWLSPLQIQPDGVFRLEGNGYDLIMDDDGSFVFATQPVWHEDNALPPSYLPGWKEKKQILRLGRSPYSAAGTSDVFEEWREDELYSRPPGYQRLKQIAIAENRDIFITEYRSWGTYRADENHILRVDPLPHYPLDYGYRTDAYQRDSSPELWFRPGFSIVPNSGDLGSYIGGLAVAGKPRPRPAPADSDSDGIPDAEDNCVKHWNPSQAPGESWWLGAACDPLQCDADQDGRVGTGDFALLLAQFGNDCTTQGSTQVCSADCNGDGRVGTADFALILSEFGASEPVGGQAGYLLSEPRSCL